MRLHVSLLVIWLSAAWLGRAARGQASPDSVVRGFDATAAQRLFGEFMSPYCPGLTLATCPSPGADSLRGDIELRLSAGESPRAIRAAYAAAWGEEILGAPPWRGWGVVLWMAPALALALGAVALSLWLRAQRRRTGLDAAEGAAPAESAGPPLDAVLAKRLEEELAALDDP